MIYFEISGGNYLDLLGSLEMNISTIFNVLVLLNEKGCLLMSYERLLGKEYAFFSFGGIFIELYCQKVFYKLIYLLYVQANKNNVQVIEHYSVFKLNLYCYLNSI